MSDTITLTGNIATIPEHKKIAGDIPLTSFRLASSQRRLDRATGEWVDGETNWYTISLFRALAEHGVLSLRKGDRVIVTGRLKIKEWDNGTRKGLSIEVEADAIGHDLKFGTSTFQRANAGRPPAEPEASAWAVPGGGNDDGTSDWATAAPAASGAGTGLAAPEPATADVPTGVGDEERALVTTGERPF
jgi:single-strand DNA-binding protein